jgi:hypothetical protein
VNAKENHQLISPGLSMSFFDEITPASPDKVNLYMPYFMKSMARRNMLPKAITLYYKGGLTGYRNVANEEQIPFVANWVMRDLPGDMTRCRMQFEENSDLIYELSMMNSEFISFLIDWLISCKDADIPDFPQIFYRKLLKMEE